MQRNWDKLWQWGLGIAFPVALGSVIMDRHLLETVFGLWENVTPARLLFFLSSAFLILGLARNSARLRELTEPRSTHGQTDHRPHRRPIHHTLLPHHHERELSRETVRHDRHNGGSGHATHPSANDWGTR